MLDGGTLILHTATNILNFTYSSGHNFDVRSADVTQFGMSLKRNVSEFRLQSVRFWTPIKITSLIECVEN
jgi:hypothetical protein